MKALYILAISVLIACCFSCKKKLKEFDLSYSDEVTIPGNSILNLPFNVSSPEMTTNSKQKYESEGTSPSLINSVSLSSLLFQIKSPASANFDFLNSLEIYLSAPDQAEILVASKYNIPENGARVLVMDVGGDNLKNYISQNSYTLRVKTVTDKFVANDIVLSMDAAFHVSARLKGLFKK